MAVDRVAKLFVDVGTKHRLIVEPNKKRFVVRGKTMDVGIVVSPQMGTVEVRYGIHLPSGVWRYRPSCFENVEKRIVSGKDDLVFETGSFKGDLKSAIGAFEDLCRVFDFQ